VNPLLQVQVGVFLGPLRLQNPWPLQGPPGFVGPAELGALGGAALRNRAPVGRLVALLPNEAVVIQTFQRCSPTFKACSQIQRAPGECINQITVAEPSKVVPRKVLSPGEEVPKEGGLHSPHDNSRGSRR